MYMCLPMGISGSPDIFQEKMSGLMESLEFTCMYLDNLLMLTKGTYDDHLLKLRMVLCQLLDAGLFVNSTKCTFATNKIEYLGYILMHEGIKPQPEKVSAILARQPPTNVKGLR